MSATEVGMPVHAGHAGGKLHWPREPGWSICGFELRGDLHAEPEAVPERRRCRLGGCARRWQRFDTERLGLLRTVDQERIRSLALRVGGPASDADRAGPQVDRDTGEAAHDRGGTGGQGGGTPGVIGVGDVANAWITASNITTASITTGRITFSANTVTAGPIVFTPGTPPVPPTLTPSLPCVCGQRNDGNWLHGTEECTWEG